MALTIPCWGTREIHVGLEASSGNHFESGMAYVEGDVGRRTKEIPAIVALFASVSGVKIIAGAGGNKLEREQSRLNDAIAS